ncbi:MAG: hypothetical protein ACJZZ8_03605 [Candidatus Neomarinimicrobiota bacterium]|jgi:hypothetical protein|tara:strand:+ start:1962 stop:2285 length:324 start_codon:yes stop_codon:yes gene_type:complete
MIRNLQVLAIALLVSSVSLAFGQAKEVEDVQIGKSVVGSDGVKKAAPAATPKKKPGKDAKVYVGKSHETGTVGDVTPKPEGKRRSLWQRITGQNSDGENNPAKKKKK